MLSSVLNMQPGRFSEMSVNSYHTERYEPLKTVIFVVKAVRNSNFTGYAPLSTATSWQLPVTNKTTLNASIK
jgi:hypothetical protein